MIIRLWPIGMMKADLRDSIMFLQNKAYSCTSPVFMCIGKLQLEFSLRYTARNDSAPIVSVAEVQFVLSSLPRLS